MGKFGKKIKIRALKEIPAFVDPGGEVFVIHPGDKKWVTRSIADLLIRRGSAVKVR